METISTGLNGPFALAARKATAEPQTATVYALRAEYDSGEPVYYDVQTTPHSDEKIREFHDRQWWADKNRGRARVDQVSRQVTITATDWAVAETPAALSR